MESQYINSGEWMDYTPAAAVTGGDIIQLPDGRAAHSPIDVAAGVLGSFQVKGKVKVTKTADIALLHGGDACWDVSTGKLHFRAESGTKDFLAGIVYGDYLAADTEAYFLLNERANYTIDLHGNTGEWIDGSVAGTTATAAVMAGGTVKLNLLATNEAQGAALVSAQEVLVSAKPIAEFKIAQYAASGSTVDMDWGLAESSHASDFDALGVFAAFHTDGGDANIDTHSDDGGTDRALADSTIDLVDDTYAEYWIDARDDTNVKFYVNGVLVDTAASKRILTAALATSVALVIEAEKTTGTETAEVRVARARCRCQTE